MKAKNAAPKNKNPIKIDKILCRSGSITFPEKQKKVVAHVTEKKPEMVAFPVQRTQPNTIAKQWLELIQRIAPKQYEAILSEYEKNPF